MDFLSLGKTEKDSWVRYLLGVLAVLVVPSILEVMIFFVVFIILFIYNKNLAHHATDYISSLMTAHPVGFYALGHGMYLLYLLALFLVVRFIHQRRFITLVTPARRLDWKKVAWGFAVFFLLSSIMTVPDYLVNREDYRFIFNPGAFFAFLPLALVLTPLQTTVEELIFRGYLLQGLSKLTRNFMVLSLINAALFTIPHLWNPEVKLYPYVALSYLIIGFLLSICTLKSNGLEVAIGIHAANNLSTVLLVNYEPSPFGGIPTVFITRLDPVMGLICLCIIAPVFYLLLLRYLKRNPVEREPEAALDEQ